MGKNGDIKITKEGHDAIPTFKIRPAGRILQLTQDGSNWEIRVHMMADLSKLVAGPDLGEEIIGEVVIRSYNGGIAPLAPMAQEAAKMAQALTEKIMQAMQAAQRGNVEVVKDLPPDLKMRN